MPEEEKAGAVEEKPAAEEIEEEDYVEPAPPVRPAVDEWCFHNSMMIGRMDILRMLEMAAEIGAEGVGFDYFMLSKELRRDPAPLKEIIRENGLEVAFGFGAPFALPDIVHNILENRKDEMFELAHEFDSSVIRVCGGVMIPNMFHKSIHVVINRDREIDEVSKRLKEFTEDASLEGLTVALENHSDYRVDEMIQIIDCVGHDHFKVTLDTGNAVYLGEDPVETARRLAPFTAYTHIKDAARNGPFIFGTPLGEGEVDLPAIIQILQDYSYEGLYAIEVDLPVWKVDREEESLRASMDYLRTLGE